LLHDLKAGSLESCDPSGQTQGTESNPKERSFGKKMIYISLNELLILNSRCGWGYADLPYCGVAYVVRL
jgi:hypothetical protein